MEQNNLTPRPSHLHVHLFAATLLCVIFRGVGDSNDQPRSGCNHDQHDGGQGRADEWCGDRGMASRGSRRVQQIFGPLDGGEDKVEG